MRFSRIVSYIVFIALLVGCETLTKKAKAKWEKKIEAENYLAYKRLDASPKLGSVVYFNDGVLEIISTIDDCMPDHKIEIDWVVAAKIATEEYISLSAILNAELPKAYEDKLNFSALGNGVIESVRSIKMDLGRPEAANISKVGIERELRKILDDPVCIDNFTGSHPDKYVVLRELRAQGMSYQLIDSNNQALTITADIAEKLVVDESGLKRNYIGSAGFEVTDESPISIGYQVARITTLPDGGFKTEFIGVSELEQIRDSSVLAANPFD